MTRLRETVRSTQLSSVAWVKSAWPALTILLALAMAGAIPAAGDTGAGVGANPIVLAEVASAGNTYQLPSLYVVNTGTVPSHYRVKVEQFAPRRGLFVPPSWITFDRNGFLLMPKESTSVKLTLAVPSDAATGKYVSDVVAGTEAATRFSGAVAGAQAATKLMFTVGTGRGRGFSWPSWIYLLIGCGLALIVLIVLQRRFGVRLKVERRH
jgi:hypothetical protein